MDFSNKNPSASSTSAQMFSSSAEYLQTVERCWDKSYYNEQKKLMKQFLVLQRQGVQSHVPHHTTVEDMSNWLVKNKTLEQFRKEAAEGNDIAHLTWEVNTQLRMRDIEHEAFTELATDLSQPIDSLDLNTDLSYLNPEVCDEVVRALKSISRSLAFQPYSKLCCPSKVVVDIVPRLLQALWSRQMEGPCDRYSMALSNMSVTIVLPVVDNLSGVLKALPVAQVYYSRSTGVRMVHSLNRKIQFLSSPEDLRRTLLIQSSTLISTIIEAVSTKVQRMFEAPADYIPLSSIRSWLSEPKASEVRPKCSDQLVISSELLRTIIGLIVYVVFEGHLEEDINLHYWPLINDIIHQLSLCGVKVTKRASKANWHLGWDQILEMVTNIHTHLHHYTGTELVLKFATSARATMLTRHMVHHVVEELVKLKDLDEGTTASGSSESVDVNLAITDHFVPILVKAVDWLQPLATTPAVDIAAPLITNSVKVDNITTTLTTTPVDLQSGDVVVKHPAPCIPTAGFATAPCILPPGFSPAPCTPPPSFALASCTPPPGFSPVSCPPPPGFSPASCPPPPGFAPAPCIPPPGFAPAPCTPPPGFAPAPCIPPPGFASASCTPPPGFSLASLPPPPVPPPAILRHIVLRFLEKSGCAPANCNPPPGFAPAPCTPPPGFAPAPCIPPPGFASASCTPRPGFAPAPCTPPPGFSPAPCIPPPGFSPAPCTPPPGFAPAPCIPPPGFGPAPCTPPPGFSPAPCIPPPGFASASCTPPPGFALASLPPPPVPPPAILRHIVLRFLEKSGCAPAHCTTPPGFAPAPCTPPPGFAPAPCIPPPGFASASCTPPPGFSPATCTPSPCFAANAMPGFGTKVILKQMVLLFLERLPPASEDLVSECLTVADRICTLFQSITARFRNIINEDLEKCTDSDSKQYWAYTFYWEYMKRYPSSQCLGIEAFTCDEERCLVVANLFAKKMYPKMFLSAEDLDTAEDSGSNGSVDMNLAISDEFVPNPVKVLEVLRPLSLPDIKEPLTTIHDKVVDNTTTTLVAAPVKVDNITTPLALTINPVNLKVTDEPVDLQSEDVVVIKPKKSRVMRFFRRLFCRMSKDDFKV
ncbi:uncharacterized protein LOC121546994 isoform X1 [Coregonus clupeaformis]|uniref:uncharacterized protein LOC121546994 isoform X1 n=1 Tax=Coregonus clupeaformis TaxID=59861 RepID=UPI001E1C94DC|nr:uncharacterized protein LOC121546994 isoform X1 [Coregonus clupeaformis]